MKFSVLFLILVFSFTSTHAQKIMVGGKESNGKLQWSDFTGKIDRKAGYHAYTAYGIFPKVGGVNLQGDSVKIESFEVTLTFDSEKSWSKKEKQTDELLVHEQGHFNIGILCMREILAVYKATKFKKAAFGQQMQNMVSGVMKKYYEMGLKYDEETEHSMNKAGQEKWNKFFAEQLALNP